MCLALAGCGGAPTPTSTGAATTTNPVPPGQTSAVAPAGGVKGYDCATLLTPAELDTASGLKGGTVITNRRGDQGDPGSVMGVTECGIAYENGGTWFGHFVVATGRDAITNFDAQWDIAKGDGATSVSGVGTSAVLLSNEAGVNMWARGANGIDVSIGIAWDDQTTTEAAVKSAEQQILKTVLGRV